MSKFMKLESWMILKELKASELARLLRISQAHIHKYLYEKSIPKPEVMKRIFVITLGSVTANDFYELSSELLEKEALKNRIIRGNK